MSQDLYYKKKNRKRLDVSFSVGDSFTVSQKIKLYPKSKKVEDLEFCKPGKTYDIIQIRSGHIIIWGNKGLKQIMKNKYVPLLEKIGETVNEGNYLEQANSLNNHDANFGFDGKDQNKIVAERATDSHVNTTIPDMSGFNSTQTTKQGTASRVTTSMPSFGPTHFGFGNSMSSITQNDYLKQARILNDNASEDEMFDAHKFDHKKVVANVPGTDSRANTSIPDMSAFNSTQTMKRFRGINTVRAETIVPEGNYLERAKILEDNESEDEVFEKATITSGTTMPTFSGVTYGASMASVTQNDYLKQARILNDNESEDQMFSALQFDPKQMVATVPGSPTAASRESTSIPDMSAFNSTQTMKQETSNLVEIALDGTVKLGATINQTTLQVTAVEPDLAGAVHGMKPGWKLLEFDGEEVTQKNWRYVINQLTASAPCFLTFNPMQPLAFDSVPWNINVDKAIHQHETLASIASVNTEARYA